MRPTIEAVISASLGIAPASVTDDLAFSSIPEWDSLRHVELMCALEQAFDIVLDDAQAATLTSVRSIRDLLAADGDRSDPLPQRCVQPPIQRGLHGVFLDETEIVGIDGDRGELVIRGCRLAELADDASYEEVAHLLLYGTLPDRAQLDAFAARLARLRALPPEAQRTVAALREAGSMAALRTVLSLVLTLERGEHATSQAQLTRLIALAPTAVAAQQAAARGAGPIAPRADFDHASNFLFMLTGQLPSPVEAAAMNRMMVVQAEHGCNASSFAARVAVGAGADAPAAVVAAVATFGGANHGGAIERVMEMLREVGAPERAAAYVRERMAAAQPIPGFGHRVYRSGDPRVVLIRAVADELLADGDRHDAGFVLLDAVRDAVARSGPGAPPPNVDLYAGAVYRRLGVPEAALCATFAVARMAGWAAHVLEQQERNVLIRPRLHYVGRRPDDGYGSTH